MARHVWVAVATVLLGWSAGPVLAQGRDEGLDPLAQRQLQTIRAVQGSRINALENADIASRQAEQNQIAAIRQAFRSVGGPAARQQEAAQIQAVRNAFSTQRAQIEQNLSAQRQLERNQIAGVRSLNAARHPELNQRFDGRRADTVRFRGADRLDERSIRERGVGRWFESDRPRRGRSRPRHAR
jgi:hypothetical protein